MNGRLKRKLKSERGASITFALLLFLVCAVVGSAVLVAGTAASGRMARIAESDQRYYAVNSAARLLSDIVSQETVRIDQVITPAGESGDTGDGSSGGTGGAPSSDGTEGKEYYIFLGDPAVRKKFGTDSGDATLSDLDSFPKVAAYLLGYLGTPDGSGSSDPSPASFTLGIAESEAGFSDEQREALAVVIEEKTESDGRLIFDISKTDMHSGKNYTYKLRMIFNMDKTELRDLDAATGEITVSMALKWKLSDTQLVINNPG